MSEPPVGATFHPGSGVLRWTPTLDALGDGALPATRTFLVAARDDDGATSLHEIELVVGLNRAPPTPELLTTDLSADAPVLTFSNVEDPDRDDVLVVALIDSNLCFSVT